MRKVWVLYRIPYDLDYSMGSYQRGIQAAFDELPTVQTLMDSFLLKSEDASCLLMNYFCDIKNDGLYSFVSCDLFE